MRIVDVDASYGQKKLSTQDNYIPSPNAPRPHKQTTPPTTNTRNGPVAPQWPWEELRESSLSLSSLGNTGDKIPRSPPSQESGIRERFKIPRESRIRRDGSQCGKHYMLRLLLGVVLGVARPWDEPRESSSSLQGSRRDGNPAFAALAGRPDPRGT